jgi:hypothetical protein
MTSPTSLTLKEFTALQDEVSEVIAMTLVVFGNRTGCIVERLEVKFHEDGRYETTYAFTMPDTDEEADVTPKEDDQK